MEVVVPMALAQDFHFQSASTSPYVSAPSSPKPFGDPSDHCFYASAPTSPSRAAAIYAHFFNWEDKPGRPKPDDGDDDDEEEDFDFAFGFDRQLQKKAPATDLAAADVLFENGRIRPWEPPPHLHHPVKDDGSGRTLQGGGGGKGGGWRSPHEEVVKDRGRTSSTLSTTSARSRRGSRSLSPIRGDGDFHKSLTSSSSTTTAAAAAASLIKSGGSKKWKLKDLLLFRSASEGRVSGRGSKDPLRKYTKLSSSRSLLPTLSNKRRSGGEDVKNSSSKPTDKNGSVRKGSSQAVSAHEMHYAVNRAASEELKKKTPLPFQRHGLFACLRFNPAIHSITRGFGSNSFSRRRP